MHYLKKNKKKTIKKEPGQAMGLVSQAQRLAQWSSGPHLGFFIYLFKWGGWSIVHPKYFKKKWCFACISKRRVACPNLESSQHSDQKNGVRHFFTKKSDFNLFLTKNT
jgi:hypothetical protein